MPRKFHDPAPLDAAYRLVNRKEVTHAAVLEPHRQQTLLTELGRIGSGGGRGHLCHNTPAVETDTRAALGLANQILARRDHVPKNESRQVKRDRMTRESRLWRRGS